MHKFLRAIGFSSVNRDDMQQIISNISGEYDRYANAIDSDNEEIVEYMKNFGQGFGINVCGEYTTEGNFRREYYYPYLIGRGITTEEYLEIEKHSDKESYAGICEDPNVGVSLIFYLQNMTEYLNAKFIGLPKKEKYSITLSGLSTEGRILLPVYKTEVDERESEKNFKNRSKLIAAARDGDEKAIETLTLEDMDMYTSISRRIMYEDVLSIVDTTFMPFGIESDEYTIIGEIKEVQEQKNYLTEETVVILKLICNKLKFDICINKEDLYGEPAVGRRFKGNVWIQGMINYEVDE